MELSLTLQWGLGGVADVSVGVTAHCPWKALKVAAVAVLCYLALRSWVVFPEAIFW